MKYFNTSWCMHFRWVFVPNGPQCTPNIPQWTPMEPQWHFNEHLRFPNDTKYVHNCYPWIECNNMLHEWIKSQLRYSVILWKGVITFIPNDNPNKLIGTLDEPHWYLNELYVIPVNPDDTHNKYQLYRNELYVPQWTPIIPRWTPKTYPQWIPIILQ